MNLALMTFSLPCGLKHTPFISLLRREVDRPQIISYRDGFSAEVREKSRKEKIVGNKRNTTEIV